MKKRILQTLPFMQFVTMLFIAFGMTAWWNPATAMAGEVTTVTAPVSLQIYINKYPDKTTYGTGESLDFTGMIVESVNADGTITQVTDYTTTGYDSSKIGSQIVYINYQNNTASIPISVVPGKVSTITVKSSAASYTLSWNASPDVTRYEIYRLEPATGTYLLVTTTTDLSVTFQYPLGTVHSYQIRAVKELYGVITAGVFSDPVQAATSPNAVTGLSLAAADVQSIQISWAPVLGATGYSVYRKTAGTGDFVRVGDTVTANYTDTGLKAGTAYQYKVSAYVINNTFSGEASTVLDTSTRVAQAVLKLKAGEERARLTWAAVSGADSYDIYMEDMSGTKALLATNAGSTNSIYIAEDLTVGETYQFSVVARRQYNNAEYNGAPSQLQTVTISEVAATSTAAKLFADDAAFKKSKAYTDTAFLKNNLDFKKSLIIPGIVSTNVGGFVSTGMCPQGITFAKNYLLMTAYDLAGEENSVIYVMDKSSKKLLTTLVLPTNAHVGGIAFDGKYVWLTTGTKVSSVPYADIQKAAKAGDAYANVEFLSVNKVGISASYIAYYADRLWVGSYDELNTTKMYSYDIYDFGDSVSLEVADTVIMPTRVQGVTFTKDGDLIVSRSCQLYQGLRGYLRQIDVYHPDLEKEVTEEISLGDSLNTIIMPSMNEGIALDGSRVYVLFESGAFANASYPVDRILAFKLTSILTPAKK